MGAPARIAGDAIGLKIVGEHVGAANQARQNVAAEIVRAVLVLRVGVQLLQQQVGAEKIIAHGRVDAVRIAGHGGRVRRSFRESPQSSRPLWFR